ncbi:hypothetical protein FQZ97_1122190 [compost metagenome]
MKPSEAFSALVAMTSAAMAMLRYRKPAFMAVSDAEAAILTCGSDVSRDGGYR